MHKQQHDPFDTRYWEDDVVACHSDVVRGCIPRFTFATNGKQGGDWGHGSRLKITIEDTLGDMAMHGRFDGGPDVDFEKVEILVGGDWELESFAAGLELLAKQLRATLNAK